MAAIQPECSPNLIMELTHAVERTEMLYNAAKLRVFDALARQKDPMTARDVAHELELPAESSDKLDRLLNVCANFGLLIKSKRADSDKACYKNTADASAYLTTKSDHSLLTLVDAARHQFDLAELIRENKRDETRRWFYDPEENEKAFQEIPHRFQRYYNKQDGYAKTSVHLLKAFDLKPHKTAVDLGGGLGTLCKAYKKLYPETDVTCVDMPRVVKFAEKLNQESGKTQDIQYTEADIFGDDSLPKADVYILGHLLHMFDDLTCQKILHKVRAAINDGGVILLLEKVMNPDRNGPELCLMYDIRMSMASNKGTERTLEEYRALLKEAEFKANTLKLHVNEGYNCYDAMICQA